MSSAVVSIKSESGIDLLQRLAQRPKLLGLQPELFGQDGPQHGDVIEINERNACVKNTLLTQWILKCILPSKWKSTDIQGLNVGVVFLSTDHHFSSLNLVAMMERHLRRILRRNKAVEPGMASAAIKEIVKDSLKRLFIYESFNKTELLFNFCSVKTFILTHHQASVVVIDSLSAYYWEDRLASVNLQSFDKYCQGLLQCLTEKLLQTNICIIYTVQQFLRDSHQNNEKASEVVPLYVYSISLDGENNVTVQDRRTSTTKQTKFQNVKDQLKFE